MPELIFRRREKKFLLSLEQYNSILRKILQHGMRYDSHCKDGNIYSIYNIYFDNDNNTVIRRSVSHPRFKEKFRLRSYTVPKSGDEEVYLELKRKINGIVVKRRAGLSYNDAIGFLMDGIMPQSKDRLVCQVLKEISYYLHITNARPAVYLSYDRIAMFDSGDPHFRITFDKNITTRRYDLELSKGPYGEKLLYDDEILMEIKISGAIPKWFADILTEEKAYMSGFSKYGNEYQRRMGHEFLHFRDRPLAIYYDLITKEY